MTMGQTTELVLAEETTALQVFSTDGGLDPIIQEAKAFVADFEHDLSTGAGRKRTASLAAKVAKLKVRLDDMGKEVIADAKAKVKLVDGSRKGMRDELDELKVLARKPLTDWEAEDEWIREETRAKVEAKRLADQIESDQEMALLMNENIDRHAADKAAEVERQRQAEADRSAKEQADREARLQQEAADNARAEAERKAQAERDRIEQERLDAIRREREAKDKADQAQRDRIAAEEKAIRFQKEKIEAEAQAKENARVQAEQAEINRKKAEQQAEINRKAAAEQARQQEIQRQQAEKDRIQREQEQREADTKHKGAINRQAVAELMEWAGLTDEQARASVKAIAKRQISSVTINY
jgi:hypothetical protein